MSAGESNFSFTTKVNGDLFTVRGNDIAEFTANLLAAADPGLPGLLEALQGRSTPTVASNVVQLPSAQSVDIPPTSGAPTQYTCPHGQRVHKSGAKANGSKWEAYFCPQRGTDCKPMSLDGTLWK